jgi:hypothetical protein
MTDYERSLTNLQALQLITDVDIRKEVLDAYYAGPVNIFEPDELLFENDDDTKQHIMESVRPGAYAAAALKCLFTAHNFPGGPFCWLKIFETINVSPHDSN